jgi:hypothetical protein
MRSCLRAPVPPLIPRSRLEIILHTMRLDTGAIFIKLEWKAPIFSRSVVPKLRTHQMHFLLLSDSTIF